LASWSAVLAGEFAAACWAYWRNSLILLSLTTIDAHVPPG
jgi:hypothetical protein